MASTPTNKLARDVGVSIALALVITGVLVSIGKPVVVLSNIDTFNSSVTTLLGLLFTLLALVYTFESQFESNTAVKRLKARGTYSDIPRVFFLSVAAIGAVWIYTFTLTIFQARGPVSSGWGNLILSFVAIVGYVLLIARLWRCFRVFVLLNRAVKRTE